MMSCIPRNSRNDSWMKNMHILQPRQNLKVTPRGTSEAPRKIYGSHDGLHFYFHFRPSNCNRVKLFGRFIHVFLKTKTAWSGTLIPSREIATLFQHCILYPHFFASFPTLLNGPCKNSRANPLKMSHLSNELVASQSADKWRRIATVVGHLLHYLIWNWNYSISTAGKIWPPSW